MNLLDVEAAYLRLRDALAAALPAARDGVCVVGVHSGGVWVADRLRRPEGQGRGGRRDQAAVGVSLVPRPRPRPPSVTTTSTMRSRRR